VPGPDIASLADPGSEESARLADASSFVSSASGSKPDTENLGGSGAAAKSREVAPPVFLTCVCRGEHTDETNIQRDACEDGGCESKDDLRSRCDRKKEGKAVTKKY
jgi:hypothetical protein